ncbi:hypothetical protein [Pararhizobium qamdonense]|uniref:hypothetical protein n=1 Tax=Pararhizobium qamdonense TaxID=3031126 RepID=UPI0023E17564|nr:hypothetical protein [Pararhizobium qamdonense]
MIVIHTENGEITQTVSDPVPPDHAQFLADEGNLFIEVETYPAIGELYEKYYVLDGELIERPVFSLPAAMTLMVGENHTFEHLPHPCEIELNGKTVVVTDGRLETAAKMAATYQLEFRHWPYINHSMKVVINDA